MAATSAGPVAAHPTRMLSCAGFRCDCAVRAVGAGDAWPQRGAGAGRGEPSGRRPRLGLRLGPCPSPNGAWRCYLSAKALRAMRHSGTACAHRGMETAARLRPCGVQDLIYTELPGQDSGEAAMAQQDATLPEGMYGFSASAPVAGRTHWTNAWFASAGVSATADGMSSAARCDWRWSAPRLPSASPYPHARWRCRRGANLHPDRDYGPQFSAARARSRR